MDSQFPSEIIPYPIPIHVVLANASSRQTFLSRRDLASFTFPIVQARSLASTS